MVQLPHSVQARITKENQDGIKWLAERIPGLKLASDAVIVNHLLAIAIAIETRELKKKQKQ